MKSRRRRNFRNPRRTSSAPRRTSSLRPVLLFFSSCRGKRPIPEKVPSKPSGSPHGLRAEKVARARRLIADPAYPPKAVLQAVAQTLVGHIKGW